MKPWQDLKKFDLPTLIIHGDDDQIVPIGTAALRSSKLVKNAILKIYADAPHGLAYTPIKISAMPICWPLFKPEGAGSIFQSLSRRKTNSWGISPSLKWLQSFNVS